MRTLTVKLRVSDEQAEQLKALWGDMGEDQAAWQDWQDYSHTVAQRAFDENLADRYNRLRERSGEAAVAVAKGGEP